MPGSEMMGCPHCGARNSTKRDYCYQCDKPLRGPTGAAPQETTEYVPTCASCSHASIFPPLGQRIKPDEVWCTERDEAVPSGMVAGDCFSEAFGWKREEILD